jgi:hypothetical protein
MHTRLTTAAVMLQHRKTFSKQALHLAALLGVRPELTADQDICTRLAIIKAIDSALRVEIWRGDTGHWNYDPSRHINLCIALRDEMAAVAERKADLSEAALAIAEEVIAKIAA